MFGTCVINYIKDTGYKKGIRDMDAPSGFYQRLGMNKGCSGLTDAQWARCGVSWRDLPVERFGPWHTVYVRVRRWRQADVWAYLLGAERYGLRLASVPLDRNYYRDRNKIERFFGCMKQYRRLATRCDKTVMSFLVFWHIATALDWRQ